MFDVFDASGGEVIDRKHFMPGGEIEFGKMRSDKTGAAGDEYFHSV
jgi:hypothetical protein